MATVYEQLKTAGVPLSSHESDLYAKVTPQSTAILKASATQFTTFVCQIDGGLWYNIPFAFQPFWDAKSTDNRKDREQA